MRAFLAFTSFKSHAWRGSPCWHHGPPLTTRASQQKTCLFHPAAGESHPSRLRAAISSQVTASASRPPKFTFPSLPVRQWVLISHQTPIGRRREPPGQTTLPFPPHGRRDLPIQTASIFLLSDVGKSLPATQLSLLCLYLSNAASLDLRLDAGEVLPARQSYYSVFTCPTQRVLISGWTPARCSRPDNLTFFCLYLSNTASLDLPLDAGEVLPARQSYFLLSLPVQHGESRSPVGRRRGAPGQTILLSLSLSVQHSKSWYLVGRRRGAPGQTTLLFLSLPVQQSKSWYLVGRRRGAPGQTNLTFPVFTCPTQQVLISCWTPARCSRPDNLTFPVFTCPTKQVLVSRWTPARCSRPDKSYFSCLYLSNTASLNLLLDAGEVLPARQTLFRLLAPKISNPVERDIPGRFGKLSLQSTTGEAPPPCSQVSISPQMPQEPPGWTTSPFPPASAKLTHQTGGHAHQLDVG